MADDEDLKAGELVTANYGWTKPTVGASDDQWGGYLNADLDGIDSVVHGIQTSVPAPYVLPIASTTVLGGTKVDGTTIHAAADGTLSGTPSSGPPVTISDVAPGNPQVGALWYDSVGGQTYLWVDDGNTRQWVVAVNPGVGQGAYLPLNGGALSGPVSGPSATFANLSAPQAIGDNRLINGDMRIDQRNAGASGAAFGYTVDRWAYYASQTAKGTWQRQASGLTAFPYALNFKSSSAYTALATDNFGVWQPIEADMVSDFSWGTASAQPVTLSFWVWASKTGTFSGALQNTAETRNYPFTFNIPTASTWTMIVVTIPGDTAGTWVLSGNGVGIYLIFDLGSGANFRGPAGAWATTSGSVYYVGATGAQSIVATNAATYNLTGVKLEIGSVATPYNRQSLAKSMADCQRYYQQGNQIWFAGYGIAGAIYGAPMVFPTTMRVAPTIGFGAPVYANCSALAAVNINPVNFVYTTIITANGGFQVATPSNTLTASAEL